MAGGVKKAPRSLRSSSVSAMISNLVVSGAERTRFRSASQPESRCFAEKRRWRNVARIGHSTSVQRTTDFQRLAPLIVTRDPARVRSVLVRRARGGLTLDATIVELERIPQSSHAMQRQPGGSAASSLHSHGVAAAPQLHDSDGVAG